MFKPKAYAAKSLIVPKEKGLFASKYIKKGDIIVEFKGKLIRPNEQSKQSRSNIGFTDGYRLSCGNDDLGSFANDIIDFPTKPRKLIEDLKKSEPFYKRHSGFALNAKIKINDQLHRAFIEAIEDIKPNEEILCHYGFTIWFVREIQTVGFIEEPEYAEEGFPEKIHEMPGFIEYVKLFYPKSRNLDIAKAPDGYSVIVCMDEEKNVLINIPDFRETFRKVEFNYVPNKKSGTKKEEQKCVDKECHGECHVKKEEKCVDKECHEGCSEKNEEKCVEKGCHGECCERH
jgi:hypothetical protein